MLTFKVKELNIISHQSFWDMGHTLCRPCYKRGSATTGHVDNMLYLPQRC